MSYHDYEIPAGSNSNSLLKLDGISMEFKRKGGILKALDNVTFELRENEVLGIIGESGSGKSTVARVIIGLHRATEGRVIFQGKDVTDLTKTERQRMYSDLQMVFQNPIKSFNPRRKIGASISECLCHLCAYSRGTTDDKVKDLLEDVGLKAEYADKYPHEMSGGECQRAAIARAMAVCPKILICDEATSALDVSAQARIINLLMELKDKYNMSIIFISHDLPLVSTITDRIIIMDGGKIVEEGSAEEVICSPKTDYTRELLDAVL